MEGPEEDALVDGVEGDEEVAEDLISERLRRDLRLHHAHARVIHQRADACAT